MHVTLKLNKNLCTAIKHEFEISKESNNSTGQSSGPKPAEWNRFHFRQHRDKKERAFPLPQPAAEDFEDLHSC